MSEMVLEKDGREVPCKNHPGRPAVDLKNGTPLCDECLKGVKD